MKFILALFALAALAFQAQALSPYQQVYGYGLRRLPYVAIGPARARVSTYNQAIVDGHGYVRGVQTHQVTGLEGDYVAKNPGAEHSARLPGHFSVYSINQK